MHMILFSRIGATDLGPSKRVMRERRIFSFNVWREKDHQRILGTEDGLQLVAQRAAKSMGLTA